MDFIDFSERKNRTTMGIYFAAPLFTEAHRIGFGLRSRQLKPLQQNVGERWMSASRMTSSPKRKSIHSATKPKERFFPGVNLISIMPTS
jgi:hypothetical protein